MSNGAIGFLAALTVFLAFYAYNGKDKGKTLTRDEFDANAVGIIHTDDAPTGLFERIVRPAVRNILPQTPLAVQVRARNSTKATELLVKSGNPWNIQPEELFGVRVFAALVGLGVGLFFAVAGGLPYFLCLGVGLVLGWMVPKVLLDGAKGRRLKEARRGLPEAIDLLVITTKSGKRLDTALAEAQAETPPGVVKDELARVVADLKSGRDIKATFTDFARRAPSREAEAFARSIIISERMGSDVADTLVAQAAAARASYEQALDVKIGKLQTTLFFPIMGFMLPALFIVMLAPSIASIGATFS